jgi:hypothetical protein
MNRFDSLSPSAALTPVPEAEVADLEAELGFVFPTGYREFITKFGRGVLGGLVRIYTPADIRSGPCNIEEWRKRIDEYWFWDAGANVLTKPRALQSIIVGDTVGGDELIFHPDEPDRLYVLPHDFEEIWVASTTGLDEAADWFFKSGVIDEPFEDDRFEPY